jgi:hypothetical protein
MLPWINRKRSWRQVISARSYDSDSGLGARGWLCCDIFFYFPCHLLGPYWNIDFLCSSSMIKYLLAWLLFCSVFNC